VKLSISEVRRLARERNLSLTALLDLAGVSRTAFYSLARRDSVLPRTVRSVALALRVSPIEILDPSERAAEAALASRLDRARRISLSAPQVDFQNVWHSLVLLELPPVERLNRSLLRGRSHAVHS
jgi:hypothetical protein